ncbi:hypothetical protein MJ560_08325 [Klebsiella pneumoniae]|nr:hypothetical protein MJ560_08325 [Klebsiella pneumoniae]
MHIARRLSGTARWGLTQSAPKCGASSRWRWPITALNGCLCLWQLPVGVLTVSLGGIYPIALLIQESRKK